MGFQYQEHDSHDDTDSSRHTQYILRWVHSCRESQQEHITHTRGRYSPLSDGSTHAESDNNTKCTLEADTAHSQMGPLMPRVTRTYNALEADTAYSQMGPLMPRVTTRTHNAHSRQIKPTHRWVHSCRESEQEHITHTRGRYIPLSNGSTHAESDNNTKCTLEADTAHSQMGPLMPRVTRTYNALEADTAHSQMGPLNAMSMHNMTSTQWYTFQADIMDSQMAGFHQVQP